MEKNHYKNGKVKAIVATEENAYESEVYEFENKEKAIEGLKAILHDYLVEEEELNDVENSAHYTSADGYHIIGCIVENESEEMNELDVIEDEWRKPMIREIEEEEEC